MAVGQPNGIRRPRGHRHRGDRGRLPGAVLQSEDGRRSFTVYASVRYEVDGTLTRGRVALGGCRHDSCPARHRRGEPITIAYDPQQLNRVDLASRVVGRHPLLDPWVLASLLLGVVFLVTAAVNMAPGT